MAVSLEQEIMAEIGLGQNYRWFNGSRCDYVRAEAVRQLRARIAARHDADPTAIAPPDDDLIRLAASVHAAEPNPYDLTHTWQACATIIAAHIHAAPKDAATRRALYEEARDIVRGRSRARGERRPWWRVWLTGGAAR